MELPDIDRIVIIDQQLSQNEAFVESLQVNFNKPIEHIHTVADYYSPDVDHALYISSTFDGDLFDKLIHDKKIVISDLIVDECIARRQPLPVKSSLFNLHMKDFLVCFSLANKHSSISSKELNRYLNLIRFMGGKSRRDMKSGRSFERTHLIESTTDSDNYRMARVYELPILDKGWIDNLWINRRDLSFNPSNDGAFRIKPFHQLAITLYNFDDDTVTSLTQTIEDNNGKVVSWDDPRATHLVCRDGKNSGYLELIPGMSYLPKHVVSDKWITTCLETKYREIEEKFELEVPETLRQDDLAISSLNHTLDNSANRFRLSRVFSKSCFDRSMDDSVLLSSPSHNQPNLSPNDQKKFLVTQELYQNEVNYVTILKDVIRLFQAPLLTEHSQSEEFPNDVELKTMFGGLKPIISVHEKVLVELEPLILNWSPENEVGSIYRKHSSDFLSAYPQYINFYEKTREMIDLCLQKYPKFATFVKAVESTADCKKQRFNDLLINPIQRLPRIELQLRELLKKTDVSHPDHESLQEALNTIVSVNSEINLEKKKTEGQMELFELMAEIEECPAIMISAKRHFIAKCDVKLFVCTDGAIEKLENVYTILLFSDVIYLCKKRTVMRSHSLKERTSALKNSMLRKPKKLYKFLEQIDIWNLLLICEDIISPDYSIENSMFVLAATSEDTQSERNFAYYPLIMKDPDMNKSDFLRKVYRCYDEYFINNPDILDRRAENLYQSLNFNTIDYEHCHYILTKSVGSETFGFIRKAKRRLNRTLSNKSRQSMRSSISMENICTTPR